MAILATSHGHITSGHHITSALAGPPSPDVHHFTSMCITFSYEWCQGGMGGGAWSGGRCRHLVPFPVSRLKAGRTGFRNSGLAQKCVCCNHYATGSVFNTVSNHLSPAFHSEVAKQSHKTLLDIFERYIKGYITLFDAMWSVQTTV